MRKRTQFSLLSPLYLLFCKCILASLQKSLSARFSQRDLQHHIKPMFLHFLHGSMTPLSNRFVPLMESVYTQAAEGKRFARRGRANHASAAVCGNGAQREIKWISLFQDDRLLYCLGPINCDQLLRVSALDKQSLLIVWELWNWVVHSENTVLHCEFPYLLVELLFNCYFD